MKKIGLILLILWLLHISWTQQNIIEAERFNSATLLQQTDTIDNLTMDVADLKRESKQSRHSTPPQVHQEAFRVPLRRIEWVPPYLSERCASRSYYYMYPYCIFWTT